MLLYIFHNQLRDYGMKKTEHGLSIDADDVLWMDSRVIPGFAGLLSQQLCACATKHPDPEDARSFCQCQGVYDDTTASNCC